ncbi:hypothetical protein C8Q80DRAFT_1276425 [Daedaleopsis nitida]|nr:hypothetical protein C8Q80DRAFT_1276425 [Daedaleopsis nitida]
MSLTEDCQGYGQSYRGSDILNLPSSELSQCPVIAQALGVLRRRPIRYQILIIVRTQPSRITLLELGMIVLPELPRLHTLRIFDAVWKHNEGLASCFQLARDVELQRKLLEDHEKHAPALWLVAFTTEFE